MRTTVAATLALGSLVSAQNVIKFDLTRGTNGIRQGKPIPLGRRDTFTQATLNNITAGGYFVDVKVGTPPKAMTLLLDTGSSDTWVVSSDAPLCSSARLQELYGDTCGATYNPADSSTYKLLDAGGFAIQYLDQSSATGDYISDNLAIGAGTVKGLQMGLVDDTARGTGILGVGFPDGESTRDVYPNVIDQFADQGLIGSKAYSLWLNDRRSTSGTILLGGIDTDKFIGPLQRLDILKTVGGIYTALAVPLYTFSVTPSKGSAISVNATIPAILDSGTTLSYLPDDMTTEVFEQLNVYTDDNVGLSLIDCDYLTKDTGLLFEFAFGQGSAATIQVPVYEMILDILGGYESLLSSDIPFDDVCVFGLQSAGSFSSSTGVFALLGDTFLRSAYVVYDLDHKQIGIAQANLNSSTSDSGNSDGKNIVELNASDDGLPDVTGVAAQQTTYTPEPVSTSTRSSSGGGSSETGKGSGSGGGGGGAGATATSKPTPTNGVASGRAGGPGFDGLAVMAVAGVFAVVGGALFVL